MKRWGRVTERKNIPQGWDVFDPATASAPPATLSSDLLKDDLLGEIDDLLQERDFLIGFWQAPGE